MRQRTWFRLVIVVLLAVVGVGCALLGLREDLQTLGQASLIEGRVGGVAAASNPVCVLLLKDEGPGAKKRIVAQQIVYPPETFRFLQPPGSYYLLAFEDADQDLVMQAEERVGWYGQPTAIAVTGDGRAVTDLLVELRGADQARLELPQLYAPTVPRIGIETASRYLHAGEVVPLDDPRFARDVGEMGMWEPVKFLEQYGGGVFFLEPFAKDKIPVLFVHGMGGSPQNFKFLIDQLDHDRFQPWVMQYPSGLRLSLSASAMARLLRELHLRHGFDRLHIVAHSMGGLVAREAINQLTRQQSPLVATFVSLSSPWQGHPGSRTGVEKSPVVIPCWYDMAPGSPFLQALPQTPLPEGTDYYLFFSHKGESALFAGESSDGTLPLSSMTDLAMQDAARKVLAFSESHAGMLTSPEVARRLNRLLAAPGGSDRSP